MGVFRNCKCWTPLGFLLLGILLPSQVRSDSKIESGLFSSTEETKDVIVHFGSYEEMQAIAHQISYHHSYSSKETRIYALYQAMSSYSTKCKSSAQSYLDSASYTYHDMWSSNTMIIRDADQGCVTKLADMKDVNSIQLDKTFPLIEPIMKIESYIDASTPGFVTGSTWGLRTMLVHQAWKYLAGYGSYGNSLKQGTGIVVSAIDTGVNVNHVRLHENYRGYAAWKDGYNISRTPEDLNGHGSHTMGTICGKNGVGVAPGQFLEFE